MADSITQTGAKALTKPPMAVGPIPKPDMRRHAIKFLRRWSYVGILGTVGAYVGTYFFLYEKHKKAYDSYIHNMNPDKLYREMVELGAFKSVKASWQKEIDAEFE